MMFLVMLVAALPLPLPLLMAAPLPRSANVPSILAGCDGVAAAPASGPLVAGCLGTREWRVRKRPINPTTLIPPNPESYLWAVAGHNRCCCCVRHIWPRHLLVLMAERLGRWCRGAAAAVRLYVCICPV